jgi:DNA mismatch repair protein MutS
VLKTLEQGEQASALTRLADDLPLFAVAAAPEATKLAEPSAAEEALRAVNPDELSPKEALELLYQLRGLVGLK